MAKRRRQPTPPSQDENTSDFDSIFFQSSSAPTGSPEKPVQRNAANARERARMRVLSHAFSRLKTSLPWTWPFTMNNRSGCDDATTNLPCIENRARMDNQDTHAIYNNYAPCEYMTTNYCDQSRRELFTHYQHQNI
ncbi:hypothetical protein TNIN_115461 [Trichonephila inaurata madagascariensis]|uniref:BHLH domain-containing protein n=1 Tax=Trichonephila inaurata madagascariensis TaxID=2747483 RepID=A0A8X6XDX0_9ARAC|nr:hypothetical protein TNIN_115461 [Trichonephila inaurata madagascariensis]